MIYRWCPNCYEELIKIIKYNKPAFTHKIKREVLYNAYYPTIVQACWEGYVLESEWQSLLTPYFTRVWKRAKI